MKVSELEGAQLDYWVAKAIGYDTRQHAIGGSFEPHCYILGEEKPEGATSYVRGDVKKTWYGRTKIESLKVIGWVFEPSTNWSQGGPLIEGYVTELGGGGQEWYAERAIEVDGEFEYACEHGSTPLIAVCRCIVASKHGEEVDERAS